MRLAIVLGSLGTVLEMCTFLVANVKVKIYFV